MFKSLTVDIKVLSHHKLYLGILCGFTLSFYLLMIKYGQDFNQITRGVSVSEFRVMNAPFPILWHWSLIWGGISLYPLIESMTKKYKEQCLLKVNSRMIFWLYNFLHVGLLCSLFNILLLIIIHLFLSKIVTEMMIVSILGQVIVSEVCLLASNVLSSKMTFGLIVLFPVLGINNHNTWLPANFLMRIRIQENSLWLRDVIGREVMFLLIILILGCLVCNVQQFYSVSGGRHD